MSARRLSHIAWVLAAWGCAAQKSAPPAAPLAGASLETPAFAITPAPRHPLDPLDAEEMSAALEIWKTSGKLTEGMLFPIVVLQEPPKADVLAFREGGAVKREVFAVILDRRAGKTIESVVDIAAKKVVTWAEIPGVQPGVLIEEFDAPKEIVRNDPRFLAAMKRRGIAPEDVQIDTWAAGVLTSAERATNLRLLRSVFFLRGKDDKNPYFRPIEGVIATTDLAGGRVLDVVDTGVVPVVRERGELDEASIRNVRKDLKPLLVVQPEGRSFSIHGSEVRWQKWRFRVAMHPREGAVVHTVSYDDDGNVRSVLYRGSLSEMVVPYGDTDPNWIWRNAFDLGEYGVGRLANTLQLGLDAPHNAVLLDAVFADDFGKAYVQKHAIAVYERDAGILWKHFDFESQHDETRRERELVVKYVATIGNYDYGLSWVFTQHGAIHIEAELTGIMLAKGVNAARSTGTGGVGDERFGRLVHPNVVAPNHQHFFNFRLDLDVDGAKNSVVELNNRPLGKSVDNIAQNAFVLEETRRKSERSAVSMMDMNTHRFWRVVSTDKTNALGHPTAYQLMAGHNTHPYLAPNTVVRKRAGFIDHHFWATKFRENELNAAGAYVNQSLGGDGLTKWIADDESIDGEDIVVWYTFGVTHNPRPEEWPVMPSHRASFSLLPDGFFTRNPALDVAK